MKKRITQLSIAMFSLFLLTTAYAGSGAIVIESEYTFDTVPDGTIVFHDFIIKNNKDIALKINSVKAG
ncbi:MAG: hypothetical protein K8S13_16190 [Desulfobacula sp.]|nr:hypothetical protein [Desulfobacula sp.]